MPFTDDASIVTSFASELRHDLMPASGEAFAEAIALANAELQELARPGAILLLTDGISPDQVERVEQAGSVPVHLLAIGRALDEPALRRAASALDGSWVRVSADDTDVAALAARIDTNLAMAGPQEGGERWADAGYALVLLLLVPAAFWFRKGWTVPHD